MFTACEQSNYLIQSVSFDLCLRRISHTVLSFSRMQLDVYRFKL